MLYEDTIDFGFDKEIMRKLEESNPDKNKAELLRMAIDQWLEYIVE